MISRVYTVYDTDGDVTCYKGFNQSFPSGRIALVMVDGEAEFWALDEGPEALNQFREFLNQSEFYNAKTSVSIYRREVCIDFHSSERRQT